jgi:hypothetical protein
MGVLPCMGGWCKQRDKCLHYVKPDKSHTPSERLCGASEDPEPIRSRTEQHKAELASDPRFAAWIASAK